LILDKDISKAELIKIIRSLMSFIVIEGKGFVSGKQKETYIKQYLYTLTKAKEEEEKKKWITTISL